MSAIDALLGVAIGDALGVPFEFKSALEMKLNPAHEMVGYGTHRQPMGTWSDDSALTFCLAESLVKGYDLVDMAKKFVAWKHHAYWSARGAIFDIGRTTSIAIAELDSILEYEEYDELPLLKEQANEQQNGNGSLMRILPLLFYIKGMPIQEQWKYVWEVSALTHGHIRAAMCCLIYLKLAEALLEGKQKQEAYQQTRTVVQDFWEEIAFDLEERQHFNQFIQQDIQGLPRTKLKSGGYVIETIEASLWCFLKETSFEKTLFSVINLGHDTDTTAAVTGGLAGLYYGENKMPDYWKAALARLEDIIALGEQLDAQYLI